MKRYLLAFFFAAGLLGVANAIVLQGTDDHAQVQILKAGFFRMSTTDSITAFATGGQTNAVPLTSGYNRITTVAGSGDSVLLPPCLFGIGSNTVGYGNTDGMLVIVTNVGANPANIFAQGTSQSINAIAGGTAFSLVNTKTAGFVCSPAGIWYTIPLAP